jgi:hypothetical protein
VSRRRKRGVMGHLSTWLHDHHWDAIDNQKVDWRIVLLVSLVAIVVFIAIMLLFPGSTY